MSNVEDHEKRDNENYSKNFTRIPNIVFASYKRLSKEEKYLYSVLRFIYWDTKPRYVTLRELSEQTGFSIGALSKMLPRLHICGLIHAEIRREKGKNGKEKGNPKYHITILDIWELNRKFFSCSPNEQDAMDPSLKLVHEKEQACSPNDTSLFTKSDKVVHEKEQGRAQAELAKKDIKTTLKTNLKRENSQRDQPPTKSPLSSSQRNNALLSEQEEAIIVHWEEIIECAAPRTEKVKAAAKELARCNATKEDLIAVRDFCLRTNPEWYEKTGIDLATIVRNWSKWKSTVKRTAEKNKPMGGYVAYEPGPVSFAGTARQKKEREGEQKNIPTELKHIYDKVSQCCQDLGGSVQDAHDDALETVKFYRERGVNIVKEEFDERVDAIMEQIKEQNELDYVAQNILSTSVFKLALDKSKAKV